MWVNTGSGNSLLSDGYLSQCWLIVSEVLLHTPEGNFTGDSQDIYAWHEFKNYKSNTAAASPRGQRVNDTDLDSCHENTSIDVIFRLGYWHNLLSWVTDLGNGQTLKGHQAFTWINPTPNFNVQGRRHALILPTASYIVKSNISRTKCQNWDVFHLVLQLSLPNPLKPAVKSNMKM